MAVQCRRSGDVMKFDDPGRRPVTHARSVITPALESRLTELESRSASGTVRVIFDLNPDFPAGRRGAANTVRTLLTEAAVRFSEMNVFDDIGESRLSRELGRSYVVAVLPPEAVRWVVHVDVEQAEQDAGNWRLRAIRRVWPDFEVSALLDRSVAVIKGDAAQATFGAFGENIVWAVVDSGVDERHPHFAKWDNLSLPAQLEHVDLTDGNAPTRDDYGIGHGTPVAGIIAGEVAADSAETGGRRLRVRQMLLDGDKTVDAYTSAITRIGGVAPRCKIVSYKVFGAGRLANVSAVIAALEHIQRVNDYGRNIRIHGVNLSLGYSFYPEWFVGGYSPLCNEVDRMVASGVLVVVAAGNSGFVRTEVARNTDDFSAGVTINDPGNAFGAITVGSTHRVAPHRYGVSYFSSKGPTGDGRLKPDLVAPGEHIVSCVSSTAQPDDEDWDYPDYSEFSGTSLAAAHVSGAIAAFLSVRSEFIGSPERVKKVFLDSATDLGRVREFQGHGLVDVMRAIQSV